MTIETELKPRGATPYSLNEVLDMFLADLRCVDTTEIAAHLDNPLLGRLFELVLERRRVARLRLDEGTAPDTKTARH